MFFLSVMNFYFRLNQIFHLIFSMNFQFSLNVLHEFLIYFHSTISKSAIIVFLVSIIRAVVTGKYVNTKLSCYSKEDFKKPVINFFKCNILRKCFSAALE